MAVKEASRTAVLVCQARAIANDRLAIGRLSDPFATHLLRDAERVAVDRARSGTRPDTWRERMEAALLARNTTVAVSRAVVIDDAVRAKPHPQLVILGAGLDARAYRLPELAGVDVYEVDFPATQQDKHDRIKGLRPVARSLRHVPVDFGRDALGSALAAAGHDTADADHLGLGGCPALPHEGGCRRDPRGDRRMLRARQPVDPHLHDTGPAETTWRKALVAHLCR